MSSNGGKSIGLNDKFVEAKAELGLLLIEQKVVRNLEKGYSILNGLKNIMKNKVIGISGLARSGKDTVADYIKSNDQSVEKYSSNKILKYS